MNSPFSPSIIMERRFCLLPVFIISIGSTHSGKELMLLSFLPGHLPESLHNPFSQHLGREDVTFMNIWAVFKE